MTAYLAFARIGFLNMLAYRARYYVGILTYAFNVAVYYFLWRAIFRNAESIAGLSLSEMITYIAVGWTIRSFYFNEIDRDIASQVQEGRLAMNLIKPIDFQASTVADAAGQSAFRAILFTLPIGLILLALFPVRRPASAGSAALFLTASCLSFLLMATLNFLVGLIAVRTKSILGILRAKYVIVELLSGLVIPTPLFPEPLRSVLLATPFPHINYTPAAIYLGKVSGAAAWRLLALDAGWIALLWLAGHFLWERARRRLTIHGG